MKPHCEEFQALLVRILDHLSNVVDVASLQRQLLAACMACLETLRTADPNRQGTQVTCLLFAQHRWLVTRCNLGTIDSCLIQCVLVHHACLHSLAHDVCAPIPCFECTWYCGVECLTCSLEHIKSLVTLLPESGDRYYLCCIQAVFEVLTDRLLDTWTRHGSNDSKQSQYVQTGLPVNDSGVTLDAHVQLVTTYLDSSERWQYFERHALDICMDVFWREAKEYEPPLRISDAVKQRGPHPQPFLNVFLAMGEFYSAHLIYNHME